MIDIIAAFIARVKRSTMMRHLSYAFSANLLNQLRGFLLIWVSVKLLSVEEYGFLVLVTMLVGMVTDISDAGVSAATSRFAAEYYQKRMYRKYAQVIYYSLYRKWIAFWIVSLILLVGCVPLAKLLFHDGNASLYVIISLIGIFPGMFLGVENAILSGKQEFKTQFCIARYSFITIVLIFLSCYVMGILSLNVFIAINFLVNIVSGAFSTYFLRSDLKKSFFFRKDYQGIRHEFNKFGNWMFIWSVFVVIKSRIDVVMLSYLGGVAQVAYYDIATKFTKPVMLVFGSYGQVLNPKLVAYGSLDGLQQLIRQTYKFVSLLSFALLLCIPISPYAIDFIIGSEYEEAVLPLQIILVGLVFFVWTMPFNGALFALKKPFVFSLDTIIGMVVTIMGNYFLIPMFHSSGAALTALMMNAASLVLSVFFYRYYMRKSKRK